MKGQCSCGDLPEYDHNEELSQPVSNSYGFTRIYARNGKLIYQGNFSRGKKESKLGYSYCKKGQLLYVGGYKANQYHGIGIEFSNQNKFEVLKKGHFNSGKLDGCLGYSRNESINGGFGYFVNDNIIDRETL